MLLQRHGQAALTCRKFLNVPQSAGPHNFLATIFSGGQSRIALTQLLAQAVKDLFSRQVACAMPGPACDRRILRWNNPMLDAAGARWYLMLFTGRQAAFGSPFRPDAGV